MTTIYIPQLIESAEQAEALPVGTWARSDVGGGVPEETVVRTKAERQPWRNGPAAWSSSEIVGWTALVPIEAEEEWTAMGEDHGAPWIAHVGHDGIDGTREEAEAYTRRFGGFLAHRNRTPWEEA